MIISQITFAIFFSIIVFTLLILSSCYENKISKPLFVVVFFSFFILLANICDYFYLSRNIYFLLLTTVLILTTCLGSKPSKVSIIESLKIGFTWLVLLFLLFTPLLFIIPNGAIATGHLVSNDSVNHSFMIKGYEFSRELFPGRHYLHNYPRGIHSFLHYCSYLIPYKAPTYLLSATLSFYSLSFFSLLTLSKTLKASYSISAILSLLCFLPVASSYTLFVTQCASFVFTLSFVCYLSQNKKIKHTLPLALLLSASISSYGLLTFSLSLFSYLIWLIGFSESKKKSTINLFIIIFFSILAAFPSYIFAFNMLTQEYTNNTPTSLIASPGNLPGGFLSPAHISGIWFAGHDYRDSLGGSFELQMAIIFIILESFFVFSAIRKKKELSIIFITFLVPVLASVIILKNPYINFKYLSYFCPVYIFLFFIGILSIEANFLRKFLFLFFLGSYLSLSFFNSLPAFAMIPSIKLHQWSELKFLSKTFFPKGKTLVLTREDWFQEFITEKDDFIPLTDCIPRDRKVKPDYIIFDLAYEDYINKSYLKSHPKLNKIMQELPKNCISIFSNRHIIYNLNCS